jgi:polyhydroxyalkanoate synthesis regulator phasin
MMNRTIVGFALALFCVPALFAQMPDGQKPAMMPDCAAMMQQHEAMQKHMAEMDAKLQTLVDDMNKAKGSVKVDKTAAVINELVAQRAMMAKQMMDMQPKMMEHMMEHMQSGMMKGMADSMASCPMMKGSEKTSTTPAEHQH